MKLIPCGDSVINQWGHYTTSDRFLTLDELEAIGNGTYARGELKLPEHIKVKK